MDPNGPPSQALIVLNGPNRALLSRYACGGILSQVEGQGPRLRLGPTVAWCDKVFEKSQVQLSQVF